LLAAASSNSFADSVLVAEQLVDDLVLVHLLDELEEAAADKVLACFDAVQRGLEEEQDEVEGVLVVAVRFLIASLLSDALDSQAATSALGSLVLPLWDLFFFFVFTAFFLASFFFDDLDIYLLGRLRLLGRVVLGALWKDRAPAAFTISMSASLPLRLLALTLAEFALHIRVRRGICCREGVVDGEAGLLDLLEFISFDQQSLLLGVESLVLEVDVHCSLCRRRRQAGGA
jgi:hypothetical protein